MGYRKLSARPRHHAQDTEAAAALKNFPAVVAEIAAGPVNGKVTDRLDAEGMLRVFAAYIAGDSQICSMVHVPTPDEEDGKRVHRT